MFFIIYAQQKEKQKNKSETTLIKQRKHFREKSVYEIRLMVGGKFMDKLQFKKQINEY